MTEPSAARALPARRGGKVYLAGSLVGQACALLRYTILARMLGPEQLGLVATLTLASNFFEMISDTGSDRFLVQDSKGDEPQVQRLVQLVYVLRGAFMALGLALAAWPVAAYFGEPELIVGLTVLALSPLIGGLLHLDMRRFQRHNDFRAEGLALVVSELLGLAATLVAAFVVQDFTAVLYGLITRSAALVVMSHLLAERPYGLAFPPEHVARLRAFAAPLILNGVLLFAASQGDRLMVSSLLGLEVLGAYTAVLLLVLYPSVAMARFVQGIHLPQVARDATNTTRTGPADLLGGRTLLLALSMIAGFAVLGPLVIPLLFGPEFVQPAWLVALIGVLPSASFMRTWTVTTALGLGRSHIVTANTLARMSGILAAAAGYATIGGIAGVVAGFILGELIALTTGVLMLNRAQGLPAGHNLDRIIAFVLASATIVGLVSAFQYRWAPGLALVPVAVALVFWIAWREQETLTRAVRMLRRVVERAR